MTFDEYQATVLARSRRFATPTDNLVHASLGLATETGEFTTEVKRMAIYGKLMTPNSRDHMIEELGDVLWYLALAAQTLNTTLEEVARRNDEKLALRYPSGYSPEAAEARADKGGLDARKS